MFKSRLLNKLLFGAFLTCGVSAHGQGQRVDFLTPAVADFTKYGNVKPSLYTGQIGLNIPLIQASDDKFKISIDIGYNSTGFMPGRPSGIVGMNWYLSAGGAVTRKVNGAPDDSQGFNIDHTGCVNSAGQPVGCSAEVLAGFNAGRVAYGAKNRDNAFNFLIGAPNAFKAWWYLGYDYQPDEFSFNFMGHSGRFFINSDGTVMVLSEEKLDVDLSQFSSQPVTLSSYSSNVNQSQIIVTTPDGYKYYFGGMPQSLEYSFPLEVTTSNTDLILEPVINTWNLTKIMSPEGNLVTFSYKNHDPRLTHNRYAVDQSHWILSQYAEESKTQAVANTSFLTNFVSGSSNTFTPSMSWSVTKTCYLESITSDNFIIKFLYSPKSTPFYTNPTLGGLLGSFNQLNLKLDEIDYTDNNLNLIKKVNFSYNYDNTSTRLFLSGLTESGKKPYQFNYYNNTTLPLPETHGIDHWGYWNGGTSTTSKIIPDLNLFGYGDETITGTIRDPNSSICMSGLLRQVSYPTGGYSEFEYEGNYYSKRLQRTSASNFLPGEVVASGSAGGARVWKITDYNGIGTENVREFKYVKGYAANPSSTTSSGFLLDYPKYAYFWEESFPSTTTVKVVLKSSAFHSNYNTSEHFVNYSEVAEVTNGIGFTVHKFTNYESNADVANDFHEMPFASNSTVSGYLNVYKNYVGYSLNDRSFERGKELFIGVYDPSGNLIKGEDIEYYGFNPSTTNYAVGILSSGTYAQSYKIYGDVYKVKKTTSTVKNSGQPVTTVQNFTYDSFRQVDQITTTSSKGEALEVNYQHPNDINGTNDPTGIYNAMTLNNAINYTVTEQTKRGGIQTAYVKNKYYSPATGLYRLQTVSKQALVTDNVEDRNYFAYSASSGWNVENVTGPAIPPTSYIWGYNKQYPIAEAKNAQRSEIYHNNFEEATDYPDWAVFKDAARAHTGKYSGRITRAADGEYPAECNTWFNVSPNGTPKKFRYSGWVYSNGPTVQLVLMMKKPGETSYVSYDDAVGTSETNKWVYLDKEVTIPGDVSTFNLRLDNNGWVRDTNGNVVGGADVWFDDLRVTPAASDMKTYTYEPQVGIKSIIDNNGITTYYQYDAFKRLETIKDMDENIIQRTEYNYKQ